VVSDKLEKLRAKRAEMNANIRKELRRDRAHKRRQDTCRKIIAAAPVLTEADPMIWAWLKRTVDKALKRADERALFGPPPARGAGAPQQPGPPGSFGKKAPSTKVSNEGEVLSFLTPFESLET
jgi:hypothetical protein